MAETSDKKSEAAPVESRGWVFSLFWSAVIVAVTIIASATINPMFDRYIHWDWVAGAGPAGFILLAVAFRRRWV